MAAGQLSAGTKATATTLPKKAAAKELASASAWRTSEVVGSGVIVEQHGRGSGAVGFFGARAQKASGGGLLVGSCPGLTDDAWFLGLGSGAKHFSTVFLTNLGDSPAAVDLQLWGREGAIDAVDATGVVIKPFTTRRIRMDALAAGEPELALRVLRRRGAVSAVVNDVSTAVYRGTEPITTTAAPATSQMIGGLASGADGRTLALLNPGSRTARVDVQVIGSKNTFTPEGLNAIKVKAGSLRLVEVPPNAGGEDVALKLRSDVPVAATVRVAPTESDFAYAEAVPALVGPAVVPVALGPGVKPPDLVLTAPRRASSARVLAYDATMKRLAEVEVKLEDGTTHHLDTSKAFTQKGIAYIVVQPRGSVVGAATYRAGSLISSLALQSAPLTVLAPQVRPID